MPSLPHCLGMNRRGHHGCTGWKSKEMAHGPKRSAPMMHSPARGDSSGMRLPTVGFALRRLLLPFEQSVFAGLALLCNRQAMFAG